MRSSRLDGPHFTQRTLFLIVLALIVAGMLGAAPARAAGADQQGRGQFNLEMLVYPRPTGAPLCPGEVYTISVTLAGTLTRADGSEYSGGVIGGRVLAQSSNPRVVSVKPLSRATQDQLFFAPEILFEIRSLRKGSATITFTTPPAKRFVTRAFLDAPRTISTVRNVSAPPQRIEFQVEDCVVKVRVDESGFWATSGITGYAEGSTPDIVMRPNANGRYEAETTFTMKALTTYGFDITCTMNAPHLEAPLRLEGELISRTRMRLQLDFGMAAGTLTTTCTAIAPGGTETGDMFDATHWSHTAIVPITGEDWYRTGDFPGTQGFVDSLFVTAELVIEE